MQITDRYKHCWLAACLLLLLPKGLHAQDTIFAEKATSRPMREGVWQEEEEEDTTAIPHYLWDQAAPAEADNVDDWWRSNRLVIRKVPPTVVDKLRADKKLQYDRKPVPPSKGMRWLGMALMAFAAFLYSIRVIIYILLIAGVALLILFFMRQQGFRFYRRKEDAALPDVEDAAPEAHAFDRQIQDAIGAGRFRQAVRLLHLQALYLLSERQLITLGKDKTNTDYLRLLYKTQWHQPFARLTRDYEYIWYGEVAVNAEQFNNVYQRFHDFKQALGNQP
jgi:hypothetical protein